MKNLAGIVVKPNRKTFTLAHVRRGENGTFYINHRDENPDEILVESLQDIRKQNMTKDALESHVEGRGFIIDWIPTKS